MRINGLLPSCAISHGRERRTIASGGNVTPLTTPDHTGIPLLPAHKRENARREIKGLGGSGAKPPDSEHL